MPICWIVNILEILSGCCIRICWRWWCCWNRFCIRWAQIAVLFDILKLDDINSNVAIFTSPPRHDKLKLKRDENNKHSNIRFWNNRFFGEIDSTWVEGQVNITWYSYSTEITSTFPSFHPDVPGVSSDQIFVISLFPLLRVWTSKDSISPSFYEWVCANKLCIRILYVNSKISIIQT